MNFLCQICGSILSRSEETEYATFKRKAPKNMYKRRAYNQCYIKKKIIRTCLSIFKIFNPQRIRKNLTYFRVNYFLFIVLVTITLILLNPSSILVMALLGGLWSFLFVLRSGELHQFVTFPVKNNKNKNGC